MKRILSILLILALLAALCACGADKPAQGAQSASAGQSASQGGSSAGQTVEEAADGEDLVAADGLNEYGLHDLSMYTTEELWSMYVDPDAWDPQVLSLGESVFSSDEEIDEEPYFDPELEDYVLDPGEWTDFDPSAWDDPPEPIEIDVDWDDEPGEGDYEDFDPGELPENELPESCAFLVPEGLKDGDYGMEESGTSLLMLQGRTDADYKRIVQRAKEAGFTQNVQENNTMGILTFTAMNGSRVLSVIYQGGQIMVTMN